MRKLLFLVFVFVLNIYAVDTNEQTKVDENNTTKINNMEIVKIKDNLKFIDEELKNNIWIARYNNYLAYRKIESELAKIKADSKKYARWKGDKYKELSYQLKNKIKIKENELSLISEYKDSPIGRLIKPKPIDKAPVISNPFKVIEGYTYISKLKSNIEEYKETNSQLSTLLNNINTKIQELEKLKKITHTKKYDKEIAKLKKELKDFIMVVEIVSTTQEVYNRKINQVIQEVKNSISDEIAHEIKLIVILSLLFLLAMAAKMAMKKYIEDDDKYYTTNKLINLFFIVVTILILVFSYIENASYLVTFLGFASAGIAIALKDWFMSIFGWISIMTGGHIKPGDRVKVTRNGIEVVGDVLDITVLKIVIREDTTLTSYTTNRRTGRVFFIPNNYVFTDMISNYTFDGLRTVWDVVDISITFDSNHKKAVELAREVTTTNSKGYTELARKRLNKMRKKYVLRSSNPDPRIFAFIEPHGIVISSWFHTNSHATLGLRSTISMGILDAFKEHDDIKIAYPTQSISISRENKLPPEDIQSKSII
jgi:small-conductance mechanosensitive channel